jgi:uncharacterized protein with FMN-binding domain
MKKRRRFILLIAALLIIGSLVVFKMDDMLALMNYKKQINEITIGEVNLSDVEDGTYIGHYDAILVAADVSVTMKNHSIEDIEILSHKNGKGKPAEVIVDKVVESQSLSVDTVSGCTASSKVILKAIENALNDASN